MLRARWSKVSGVVALLWTGACNSPTLPLPPPAAPEEVVVSDDATHVELAGRGAIPGALVLVFNDEPTVLAGAIVTADGSGRYRMTVSIDLSTSATNQLELWQRQGTQDSSLLTFFVPAHGGPLAAKPDAGGVAGDPNEAGIPDAARSDSEPATDTDGAP